MEEVIALLGLGMAARAILLIALLFPMIAFGNAPVLPSRNPLVVVPILRDFSPKGQRQAQLVIAEIEKIVGGAPTITKANGIDGTFIFYDFVLDDGTRIEVLFANGQFTSINFIQHDGKAKLLVPK